MPLESWILRSAIGTPPDPYLAAASAMARSARAGCGAMMIHYTRPSGKLPLVEEAKEIARAAKDVGIRIAFALAVRDQNPLVYGDSEPVLSALSAEDRSTVEQLFVRPAMSPRDYIKLTETIASEIAGPKVDVQFGPAGVQWCSHALLEAIAESSARTGRRIHMHLLETIYQRAYADQHFPDGVVRYISDIGLLSPRLTLAHGIHARPDELEMIAASGARLVTNFSSNLHLHSGLAPIAAAHRCGCAIAVGVDGLALDEDDDVIREMRLVQLAHGGLVLRAPGPAPNSFRSPSATAAPPPAPPAPANSSPAPRPISSPSTSTASTATPSWKSTRCSSCSRAATPRWCATSWSTGAPSCARARWSASICPRSSGSCAGCIGRGCGSSAGWSGRGGRWRGRWADGLRGRWGVGERGIRKLRQHAERAWTVGAAAAP